MLCLAVLCINKVYRYKHMLELEEKAHILVFQLREVQWVRVWNLWGSSITGKTIMKCIIRLEFNEILTDCKKC